MAQFWVFVGTSTSGDSKGIYRFRFDDATGSVEDFALAAEAANPTFLAIHPNGQRLYAVNAIGEFRGERTGAISAFALDARTGALTLLNQQPSGGAGPCHVVVDRTGKNVLVANYMGGSVACLPLDAEGQLRPASSVFQHVGSSINPERQEGPHAHSINLDSNNRFALAVDLGVDKVLVYHFDPEKGVLSPNEPSSAPLKPGAGPRHLAFHPNGKYAYVINELDSTVTAFAYDAEHGTLQEIQTITTLPGGFTEENYPSEILVHPNGRILYGSNRGHDTLAIYGIDPASGRLTARGHYPSGGKWPRNFKFDPSGRWMVIGNQNSDNFHVCRVDAETGNLTPTGPVQQAPAPICFKMLAIA